MAIPVIRAILHFNPATTVLSSHGFFYDGILVNTRVRIARKRLNKSPLSRSVARTKDIVDRRRTASSPVVHSMRKQKQYIS